MSPPPAPAPLALGLLGREIAHSLSPRLHAAGLAALGRDGSYGLFESGDDQAALRQIARVRDGALSGLNVTTPFKGLAAAACDRHFSVSADGALRPCDGLLSVNTLWRTPDGALAGASTDGPGLGLAMAEAGVPLAGRRALVLGAGGAAAALATWLASSGAASVALCARRDAAASTLAEALGVASVPWALGAPAELVFNATRVGHGGAGGAARSLGHLPWAEWAGSAVTVDLVYGPGPTAVQELALDAGARPYSPEQRVGVWLGSGEAMLAGQAALSLGIWSGRPPPYEAMRAALLTSCT